MLSWWKLTDHGANTNAVAGGITATHIAVMLQDEIVVAVLGKKANVNTSSQIDNDEYPPIFTACENNSVSMVRLLLEQGADPNAKLIRKRENRTDVFHVIHYLTMAKNIPLMDLILQYCANIDGVMKVNDDSVDINNGTVLHVVAQYRNFSDLFDYFMAHGANMDSVDDDGETALHKCARWGNKVIMEKLLSYGACSTITNNKGELASALAKQFGHLEIAVTLNTREQREYQVLKHPIRFYFQLETRVEKLERHLQNLNK
jgi:ankyrin repeat protein